MQQPFFQRLLLTIVSLLLFVSTWRLCMQGMYQMPVLNVQAVWQNDGFTVTWVRPAGRAWLDGLRPGARITRINGHPATRADSLAAAQALEVQQNGATYTTSTALADQLIAERLPSSFILAAWFVGIAHMYFMMARQRVWGGLILVICGSAAYAFIATVPLPGGSPLWAFDLVILSLLVFFTTCLLFALSFPREQIATPLGKRLALTSVATSLIIGLLYLVVVYTRVERYDSFRSVYMATYLVNALGALLVAVRSFFQEWELKVLTRAIATIGAGLVLGILPFCGLVLLPNIIWGKPLLSPYLVNNSLIFFSLGLVIAAAELEVYTSEFEGANDLAKAAEYVGKEMARGRKFPFGPPPDPNDKPPEPPEQ